MSAIVTWQLEYEPKDRQLDVLKAQNPQVKGGPMQSELSKAPVTEKTSLLF